LYDPKNRTFSPTSSMTTERNRHTATLLRDGRVLIAGGQSYGSPSALAELYDPKNGTFSATGAMATARWSQTSTLFSNGRVLVVGGWNDSSYLLPAALSGDDSAELRGDVTAAFGGDAAI
jgi:hypothetical protein